MDYEKKYKEALERARKWYNDSHITIGLKGNLKDIFPELAEPDDERIRKMLIKFFSKGAENNGSTNGISDKDILAWLEKQGEQNKQVYFPKFTLDDVLALQCCMETVKKVQEDKELYEKLNLLHGKVYDAYQLEKQGEKPADKVGPKFHEGDWVVKGDTIAQILDIQEQYYVGLDINGKDFTSSRFLNDDKIHLWTIKDAKEGDVLVTVDGEYPFIYKGCLDPNHPDSPVAYCGINDGGDFWRGSNKFNQWWTDKKVQRATKEQCDTLFKAMADAGYTFDFEKKELKKIEQPELTEFEDAVKDMMDTYRDAIGDRDATTEEVKKHAAYMLSLIPHKPVEWTEEDMSKVQRICKYLNEAKEYYADITEVRECMDWLNSLKDRIGE